MSDYTPPTGTPNYMGGGNWGGSTNQTKHVALQVDFLADKAKFAIEMMEAALAGFDTIEKKIIDVSNSNTMPTPEMIRAFAYDIDTNQKQLQAGLARVKEMMIDINRSTDAIQKPGQGW